MNKRTTAIEILSLFEDYLSERDAIVPNYEREQMIEEDPFETYSILYGNDYYELEDAIVSVLENA